LFIFALRIVGTPLQRATQSAPLMRGGVPSATRKHIRRTSKVAIVNRFLNTIVSWLRAGYPDGVPQTDYLPLFALLSGRLSTDEVKLVARELLNRNELDDADIGAEIIRLTDELPSPPDIERVRERLAAKGWPLDDARETDSDVEDRP
jgi:Protein of unknown function (DUF3349)